MGKIQAKSIFRLVPLIGDLGRFLWALTLNKLTLEFYVVKLLCKLNRLSSKCHLNQSTCILNVK